MKDEILIIKIQNYLLKIEDCYNRIKDLTEDELLNLHESYALTQYLINIEALASNISDLEIDLLLRKYFRNLKACRNISAHDYDSLNWSIIKKICRTLISEQTVAAVKESLDIARNKKMSTDYTNREV